MIYLSCHLSPISGDVRSPRFTEWLTTVDNGSIMASTTCSSSFSVDRWLKAVGYSMYTTAFATSGHVNYGSCINLSEKDVRAVGVKDDTDVRVLTKRVKELRKLSEEDAVKLLSVGTRNKCTVCSKGNCGSFSCPILHAVMQPSGP